MYIYLCRHLTSTACQLATLIQHPQPSNHAQSIFEDYDMIIAKISSLSPIDPISINFFFL